MRIGPYILLWIFMRATDCYSFLWHVVNEERLQECRLSIQAIARDRQMTIICISRLEKGQISFVVEGLLFLMAHLYCLPLSYNLSGVIYCRFVVRHCEGRCWLLSVHISILVASGISRLISAYHLPFIPHEKCVSGLHRGGFDFHILFSLGQFGRVIQFSHFGCASFDRPIVIGHLGMSQASLLAHLRHVMHDVPSQLTLWCRLDFPTRTPQVYHVLLAQRSGHSSLMSQVKSLYCNGPWFLLQQIKVFHHSEPLSQSYWVNGFYCSEPLSYFQWVKGFRCSRTVGFRHSRAFIPIVLSLLLHHSGSSSLSQRASGLPLQQAFVPTHGESSSSLQWVGGLHHNESMGFCRSRLKSLSWRIFFPQQ